MAVLRLALVKIVKNLPLHADIKKYPHSVIPLKSKCTTGLVCPLQVNGVCLKLAIFL